MIQNQNQLLLGKGPIDIAKGQNTCLRVGESLVIVFNSCVFQISLRAQKGSGIQVVKKDMNNYVIKGQDVTERIQFKAIYGIIRLKYNVYVILVTQHFQVANINQNIVYQVKQIQAVAIHHHHQQPYLKHLQQSFKLLQLYYSPTYDLSHRLQYHYEVPLIQSHDLIANYTYTLYYEDYPAELMTVFITGYSHSISIQNGDITHTISVISRGNSKRLGRRWLRRGVDREGNVAINYETETVYEVNGKDIHKLYSYVQQRGSIPVVWSQYPRLKLKAKIIIIGSDNQNKQLGERYLQKLQKDQKRVLLVNLIGKSGQESQLGESFLQVFKSSNLRETRMCWFDYNHEYSQKRERCFSQFIDQLKQQINQIGYFGLKLYNNKEVEVFRRQKGIIRTNCIDCLDRTNFIQSLFSKILCLEFYADSKGQDKKNFNFPFETLQSQQIEKTFKRLWRQNGNAISKQYSGTIAMRGEFLQCGRRTFGGWMNDLKTGLIRFYKGSFCDYYYQNCLDLHFKKIDLNQDEQNFAGKMFKKIALNAALVSIGLIPILAYTVIQHEFKQQQKSLLWNFGAGLIGFGVYYKVLQFLSKYILQEPLSRRQQEEYLNI